MVAHTCHPSPQEGWESEVAWAELQKALVSNFFLNAKWNTLQLNNNYQKREQIQNLNTAQTTKLK